MTKKLLSIVLPVFNESENLEVFYQHLVNVLREIEAAYDIEIIMVDDGSRDNSWKIITLLAKKDVRIKGISLSRNFGHQIALTAGYDVAQGDAVICMDTDLQHPPELIPALLDRWQEGFAIVYVRNSERVHGYLKRKLSDIFYLLLDNISSIKIPRNVQDFRLIDKKVLNIIQTSREKSRYLRGMVAWTGFKHTIVEVPYQKRHKGVSGYSWHKMFKLAFDGITSFSLFPLKIASYIGIFTILTGLGMLLYITIDALFFHIHYPLFKWLVTIIYIFIGILFLLLWLIGEYIGRIYEEIKNRPLYIIDQMLNISDEDN